LRHYQRCLLWDWWTTRNKKNAEGKDRTVDDVCHAVQRHTLDFQARTLHKMRSAITESSPPSKEQAWTLPVPNFVKVNLDAAFRMESGEGAWGFVARSDDGAFLACAAGKLWNLRDALQSS
jgi:hypothetical protein